MFRIAKWLIAATSFCVLITAAPQPASAQFAPVPPVPPDPVPTIPAGDDIILYVHGGPVSRLEEAGDLVAPLHRAGLAISNKRYTVISFDQPSQGYSSMVEPTAIVGASPTFQMCFDIPSISLQPIQHLCENLPYDNSYGLVDFSEDFIVRFVNQLAASQPQLNLLSRNIFVVGGSTGGMLTLRLAHRPDAPWLKRVVSWNPASVWNSYATWNPTMSLTQDPNATLKAFAVVVGTGRSIPASPDNRLSYLNDTFGGMPAINNQPNPEEWYRGDRDKYDSTNSDPVLLTPRAPEWFCKWNYIGGSRLERQETYNETQVHWHWRFGTAITAFSFSNDNWQGPAPNGVVPSASRLYQQIFKPTLLIASDDDDWNEGYLGTASLNGLAAKLSADLNVPTPWASALGGALQSAANALLIEPRFRWEDRYTQMSAMARDMRSTPGFFGVAVNTGHSIHNERPNYLATQIAAFLVKAVPSSTTLQPWPTVAIPAQVMSPPVMPPQDEPCNFNPLANMPTPLTQFLDYAQNLSNADAWRTVSYLMQPAQLGGNFPDGASPGAYTLRLTDYPGEGFVRNGLVHGLRDDAKAKNPLQDLADAALAAYLGDPVTSNAYADLAVTGRAAYKAFRAQPPTPAQVYAAASALMPLQPNTTSPQYSQYQYCMQQCGTCSVQNKNFPTCQSALQTCQSNCKKSYPGALQPVAADPARMQAAVNAVMARVYAVAYALRRPDLPQYFASRPGLKWIAVSAEDDPPGRPVNVPSGIQVVGLNGVPQQVSYPQFDQDVPLAGMPIAQPGQVPYITVRYTIASPPAITPVTIISPHPVATAPVATAPLAATPVAPASAPLAFAPATSTTAIQVAALAASVCLTSDAKTCLAPGAAMPTVGQKRAAIVTVTSAGHAAAGATVSVAGQSVTAATNAGGLAVVTYVGCVAPAAGPVGAVVSSPAPCQGVVSMSGYPSISIGLP